MPVGVALHIASEVANGLFYAHSLIGDDGQRLGVIHRDVSPSNILVSLAGDVRLTDFGIALARLRAPRTAPGIVKGTLQFMSPEQLRGERLDARTDQFSLGCVLHWLLTATSPAANGLERRARIPPSIRISRPWCDGRQRSSGPLGSRRCATSPKRAGGR